MTTLAEFEAQADNYQEAERIYQILNNCFPNHQQHIHGLAKARMALGKLETALPLWRKISAGVMAGSDLWYESKYQMINCVLPTDPESAGQILRQTIQLSPELPEQWRLPFHSLEAKLEK